MLNKDDIIELTEENNKREVSVHSALAQIKTGRKDNLKRLIDKIGAISLKENITHQEKMYAFFLAIKTEHQKILNSFGGSNSRMAKDLEKICDKHLGIVVGKDSYAPKQNGPIAQFFKTAANRLKSIFEFDTSTKTNTGGATNSDRVKHINGKSHQLKPSILDNPSLMRKMKAGYTDRENFGEVIAARIGRHLMDSEKVPEVSLVYDPIKKRMFIASKYIEGSKKVEDLNAHADVKKQGAKHVVYVANTKKLLEKGEQPIDTLDADLKKDLARAIVLSAVVGDHDVNPGNMIVATDANDKQRMCRIDFGHAFNDLLNASEFNGGQVRNKNNRILDFFNRSEVAGIGGDESKLWRNYPGFVPSQEIVDALNEMALKFGEKLKTGVEDAKNEFKMAFDAMKNAGDEEGIQHMRDSLNAICENISGKKVSSTLSTDVFLKEAFKEIEDFTKENGKNLYEVANVMQLQVNIDKYLLEGKPVNWPNLDHNPRVEWVKTGPEPAFTGTVSEYLLHRANQLKREFPIVHDNYWKLVKASPDKGFPTTTAYKEKMAMFKKAEASQSEPANIVSNNNSMK